MDRVLSWLKEWRKKAERPLKAAEFLSGPMRTVVLPDSVICYTPRGHTLEWASQELCDLHLDKANSHTNNA